MTYLTTPQAAALIGITDSGIRRACLDGRIPGAVKIGPVWAIPVKWAESHAGLGRHWARRKKKHDNA